MSLTYPLPQGSQVAFLCCTAAINAERTPGETACTSGLQIWVKDLSRRGAGTEVARIASLPVSVCVCIFVCVSVCICVRVSTLDTHCLEQKEEAALALLLVNHGDDVLSEYSLDVSELPAYFLTAAGGRCEPPLCARACVRCCVCLTPSFFPLCLSYTHSKAQLSVRDIWAQKTVSLSLPPSLPPSLPRSLPPSLPPSLRPCACVRNSCQSKWAGQRAVPYGSKT